MRDFVNKKIIRIKKLIILKREIKKRGGKEAVKKSRYRSVLAEDKILSVTRRSTAVQISPDKTRTSAFCVFSSSSCPNSKWTSEQIAIFIHIPFCLTLNDIDIITL